MLDSTDDMDKYLDPYIETMEFQPDDPTGANTSPDKPTWGQEEAITFTTNFNSKQVEEDPNFLTNPAYGRGSVYGRSSAYGGGSAYGIPGSGTYFPTLKKVSASFDDEPAVGETDPYLHVYGTHEEAILMSEGQSTGLANRQEETSMHQWLKEHPVIYMPTTLSGESRSSTTLLPNTFQKFKGQPLGIFDYAATELGNATTGARRTSSALVADKYGVAPSVVDSNDAVSATLERYRKDSVSTSD
jgi:hypothetical protein